MGTVITGIRKVIVKNVPLKKKLIYYQSGKELLPN